MTTQQAIEKIKEMGFTANLWTKAGKQRIYIEYNFKGKQKEGGFIGSDKNEIIKVVLGSAEYQQKWNDKLIEIAMLEIEWSISLPNTSKPVYQVDSHRYDSLAERDRLEIEPNWTWTHDL